MFTYILPQTMHLFLYCIYTWSSFSHLAFLLAYAELCDFCQKLCVTVCPCVCYQALILSCALKWNCEQLCDWDDILRCMSIGYSFIKDKGVTFSVTKSVLPFVMYVNSFIILSSQVSTRLWFCEVINLKFSNACSLWFFWYYACFWI